LQRRPLAQAASRHEQMIDLLLEGDIQELTTRLTSALASAPANVVERLTKRAAEEARGK
jgi:hypothetical protein